MNTSEPYAMYSDLRQGWDIYQDTGSLFALNLTIQCTTGRSADDAWKNFYEDQERDLMNIDNYGILKR